jgi:hypothetical protein
MSQYAIHLYNNQVIIVWAAWCFLSERFCGHNRVRDGGISVWVFDTDLSSCARQTVNGRVEMSRPNQSEGII